MKNFIRKMSISFVVTSCILFGIGGICEAYKGIRKIGFGEYRKIIEKDKNEIKIFDYTIKL